ncbi:MAG TPA: folylpolyglutamate synthase/dihydrofolate synthase family protein [Pyrinomonadaceae bacterium]|nr:folylpolyglutamate synthase/dihydrofolate synthase family protein [Pyrinomonadaceae bacterium]
MTFEDTLDYLFSLGHETLTIKLGLKNTQLLLEALSNPQNSFECVQIAGTNGKGSTAVFVDSICRAAAIHSGLFTSPHLISITERIKVDGLEIREPDFARIASKVRSTAEELLAIGQLEALPTYFEHVTAIALVAFKEAGVDLAILETGLGGRLDATTVAGARTVAITPIALDHQRYLGETLEEVAAEKAAIIREGVTPIIAPQPPAALRVIQRRCAEVQVIPEINECETTIEDVTSDGRYRVTFETTETYKSVLVGLRGRHQVTNAAVAIRIAESLRSKGFQITSEAIVSGLEKADHAGRLELIPGAPDVLLDGAHNPAGAQALLEFLTEFGKHPLTLIFGAMDDKKLNEMAAILFPVADNLVLTRAENPRSADPNLLQRLASGLVKEDHMATTFSTSEAWQAAQEFNGGDGLVCVAGSLYLVGEFKAMLSREDSISLAR